MVILDKVRCFVVILSPVSRTTTFEKIVFEKMPDDEKMMPY